MYHFDKVLLKFDIYTPHESNELPTSLPTSRKSFFDFYENLQKWSLGKINLPYFGKSAKNFFTGKKFNFKFQNRGYFRKKKVSLIFIKIYRNEV